MRSPFTLPYPEGGTSEERRAWKAEKEEKYAKWYKGVQKRAQMYVRLGLAERMSGLTASTTLTRVTFVDGHIL